jgi:superfamily I DNA and/or RNA helicase
LKAKVENLKSDIRDNQESYSIISEKIYKTKEELRSKVDIKIPETEDPLIKSINNEIKHLEHEIESQLSHDPKLNNILVEWVDKLRNSNTVKNDSEYILERYIENSNVVGISLNENPRTLTDRNFNDFDVVIIDEVSKATPTELLYVMSISKKVILVGDHRQLPPVFSFSENRSIQELFEENEENKTNNNLLTKDNFKKYKKMVTASLFKDYFEKADNSIKMSLLTQYRMHTDIMNMVNFFYENRLIQGIDNTDLSRNHKLTISATDGSKFILPSRHALWIDSSKDEKGKDHYEEQPEGSTSRINELEVRIINSLLVKLNTELSQLGYNDQNRKEVGVISFYARQLKLLNQYIGNWQERLKKFSSLRIDINTVNRFQGKEKPIIIVSMVRNKKINKIHKKLEKGKDVSFVAQYEMINVAFSRAQELLIAVGAKDMFCDYEVELPYMDKEGSFPTCIYQYIIGYLNDKGCFYDAKSVIGGTK